MTISPIALRVGGRVTLTPADPSEGIGILPGVSEIADTVSERLRQPLGRVEARREDLAKEWLIGVIREVPLAEVERLPVGWAASELPELITDLLVAVCEGAEPVLGKATLERARALATLRPGLTPARLAAELARLQGEVGRLVAAELDDGTGGPVLGAEAVARLARVFGTVSGEAQEALTGRLGPEEEFLSGLKRPERMHRRLNHLVESHRRHGHPFAVTLFDVEGPGADRVDQVAGELRGSIRAHDETYRLEDNELCVLAPHQDSGEGARMAERLSARLAELDREAGWQVTISAGVSACPEHGDQPEELLQGADTAMWRARATGRPVAVASQKLE